MPFVSLDDLRFCGLAWKFKLLPNQFTAANVQHARPFTGTFIGQHRMIWHSGIYCCKQGSLYKTLLMDLLESREHMMHKGVVIVHGSVWTVRDLYMGLCGLSETFTWVCVGC